MAYTRDDVETWLVDAGSVGDFDETVLDRIIAGVDAHAARFYDLTDADDGTDDERDQALIMECARLYMRKHSSSGYVGTDELGAVRVTSFDPDVRSLLAGRMITAGVFGPSSNTVEVSP